MMTQMRKPQDENQQRPKFSFFLSIGIVTLTIGAIIWILNVEMVITGSWSSILSIVFTALGVILALLQCFPYFAPGKPSSPVYFQQDPSMRLDEARFGLSKRKGALVVRAKKKLIGKSVSLCRGFDSVALRVDVAANIVERKSRRAVVFIALFPALEPGNYTLHADCVRQRTKVTVYAGQIVEIDWRYVA